MMKKFLFPLVLMAMAIGAVGCVENVPVGHEGVLINKTSGDGVVNEELGVGWHFVSPNQEIVSFSLREQNYTWEQGAIATRGRGDNTERYYANDESFRMTDTDGLQIGMDVGIRFRVAAGMSSDLVSRFGYQRLSSGLEPIIDGRIRNSVRSAMNDIVSQMTAEEIYGSGRTQLLVDVQNLVSSELENIGLSEVQLYWVSAIRIPDEVTTRINAKVNAEQDALTRENQVAIAEAQARIDVARADGEANALIAQARGEAESRLLIAEAEAAGIRMLGDALQRNPRVVELRAIEEWDGKLPVTMLGGDGAVPFINVPTSN